MTLPNITRAAVRNPRWHLIYFLLAAFDLLTISFSLYLNHQLMNIYTSSVDSNQVWAHRLGGYSDLSALAADVNAPGNDVFESLDVEEATTRLHDRLDAFDEKLAMVRKDLQNHVDPETAAPLLKDLDEGDRAMRAMVAEAHRIFSYFRDGQRDLAGARMATMDHRFYAVNIAINAVARKVRTIQRGHFVEQTATATRMRRFEYLIAAFIVLMVLGVTAYGHKMTRAMRRNQAKNDAFIRLISDREARIRSVLDTAGDGIIIIDQQGVVESFNPAAQRIFGCSADEVVGRNVAMLMPRADGQQHDEHVRRYLSTQKSHIIGTTREIAGLRKDGTEVPIELTVTKICQGENVLFTGIVRDVTERKRAEDVVKRAREAAESASRAKSVFLANLSHEIRTPIMAMLGAVELSRQDSPVGQLDYRDIILRNGRHLVSLIDDLLDIARLDAEKLDVHPADCSLIELITDIRALTAPLHRNEKIEYRIYYDSDMPRTIRSDGKRLKQAVINLVNNAFKFTKTGHVHLRFKVNRHAPEPRLTVSVEDTGRGIPSESLERIFETFRQLESSHEGVASGLGLGLPLTKWFVKRLGGDVEVTSTVGKGSTFVLRVCTGSLDDAEWVPADRVEDAPVVALRSPKPAPAPIARLRGSVLLAEDFQDTREMIRYALARAGADVTVVVDGREAVEAAARRTYDLILMDVRMPEMDGLTAAVAIRKKGCHSALIAITASAGSRERQQALDAGFDDFWPKPIAVQQIVDRAGAYLETVAPDDDQQSEIDAVDAVLDDDRLASAVLEFTQSIMTRVRTIREAVESGDMAQAHEMLHQLVGSAGIHGYVELSNEAARLLEMAIDGSLADHPEELRSLESVAFAAC